MNLESLGWNSFFAEHFLPYVGQGHTVGRIASEHKDIYRVYTESGELLANVSGKLRHQAQARQDFPAVGDWVVLSIDSEQRRAVINAVLPRQSKFSRKVAGEVTKEQIVATNLNTIFLVNALNNDFNLSRIERYLTLAWKSGANPVILLSKSDLCQEVENRVAEVENIAFGVPVYVVSSVRKEGLDNLTPYLTKGHTVALLGSSGAGKSTLINDIVGKEIQKVQEIREKDDRGKHTTTYLELILLPQGGLIIDTPGMRELQLWGSDEGFNDSFEDIDFYAKQCHFTDCQHQSEPGCAVRRAIEEGFLDSRRYDNYLKLQKELAYLSRKTNQQEYLANKEKWKKIAKTLRKK